MNTVVFDTATGAILRVVRGPVSIAWMQHGDGESFLLDSPVSEVSDATHYVDLATEEVRQKTDLPVLSEGPIALAVDETINFSLPGPTLVVVSGDDHKAYLDEDGEVSLQFGASGHYTVRFEMIQCVTQEVAIHVSAD